MEDRNDNSRSSTFFQKSKKGDKKIEISTRTLLERYPDQDTQEHIWRVCKNASNETKNASNSSREISPRLYIRSYFIVGKTAEEIKANPELTSIANDLIRFYDRYGMRGLRRLCEKIKPFEKTNSVLFLKDRERR